MRNYSDELISNTEFRVEYFSNIESAIADLKQTKNYEGVIRFKTIKRRAQEYIDLIEN